MMSDRRGLSEVEYEDMTLKEKLASQVAFIRSQSWYSDVEDEDHDDAGTRIMIMEGRDVDA